MFLNQNPPSRSGGRSNRPSWTGRKKGRKNVRSADQRTLYRFSMVMEYGQWKEVENLFPAAVSTLEEVRIGDVGIAGLNYMNKGSNRDI